MIHFVDEYNYIEEFLEKLVVSANRKAIAYFDY
jgi:hypothetical protein